MHRITLELPFATNGMGHEKRTHTISCVARAKKMANFKPGDEVLIQCEIGPGAFPQEMLVTFETIDGPTSGFVRKDQISLSDKNGVGFINGTVKAVTDDVLTVMVRGSFFTTTGLASLNRDWAKKHVQFARAA
jgi:hypothetical protein